MIQITNYFRNAVAASSQCEIDFKGNEFGIISLEELEQGQLSASNDTTSWVQEKIKKKATKSNPNPSINIIIALKTIVTKFEDASRYGERDNEMTSLLFMPAVLTSEGKFFWDEEKLPWIPREFLTPMIEPQISIGKIEDYDRFFEETTGERNKIANEQDKTISWKNYLKYSKKLLEYVTNADFSTQVIDFSENRFETDGRYYFFLDSMVSATSHILKLYENLIDDKTENALYKKLTSGEKEQSLELLKSSDINNMKKHVGQMNGEYSLSPSQREALHHFTMLKEGDILAVSGPPGTGKTTLLQSVVANMYTQNALKEEQAPIIVAASTNNQAVTNIIDSFGKINNIGVGNLEKRWISGVNSFAVYFPAASKAEEARKQKYQYTNVKGDFFADEIESEENRENSKKLFLTEYGTFFHTSEQHLSKCKIKLLSELKDINSTKDKCLYGVERLKKIIGNSTYISYINSLQKRMKETYNQYNEVIERKEQTKRLTEIYLERCASWRQEYDALPWYVRLFKFIPYFKNKIVSWSYSFMQNNELDFLKRDMSITEIEEIYRRKIRENDEQILKLNNSASILETELNKQTEWYNTIQKMLKDIKCSFQKLSKYMMKKLPDNIWEELDLSRINDALDSIRYVEFWFAVHYYECRWLIEDIGISEKQKGKTFEPVLNTLYHRLAMLSPCMVMTFFMLPKQFLAYDGNDKKLYYMYNYIDLLIVDEAGQTSPEIAAASFALAKKALVVGDEQQIPPVWGIGRALDIAMAISKGVIFQKSDYKKLEENGLNCSQSSLMKVASLSCAYNKYGNGLFLSEHRRCYNDIIEYCNQLVYNGNLIALRGHADEDEKNALKNFLPAMGYMNIPVEKSQTGGGSRKNNEEAEVIVEWLEKNYLRLIEIYKTLADDERREFIQTEVLGIVTPFRGQCNLLKKLIKKRCPEWEKYISVGTVHTFQGAERRVIIFSSVYGAEDGCFFINHNKNLLNVAVSRAKDSFLIFGDRRCLKGETKSAAGLLREYARHEISM